MGCARRVRQFELRLMQTENSGQTRVLVLHPRGPRTVVVKKTEETNREKNSAVVRDIKI